VELARWEEALLVRRCKEGSEAAFAELVRRHRPRLFSLAYRLTADRETAEDVVQDTFVAAFRAIDRFEPRPSLSAWLNTILLRLAARSATAARSRPRESLDLFDQNTEFARRIVEASGLAGSDPHAAAEAAELLREVAVSIAALPFKYRAAVVTRFVIGMDYAEAAASLEMGLNTYKSHLLRGTRMLREALAPIVEHAVSETAAGPASQPALRPSATVAQAGGRAAYRRADREIGIPSTARTFAESRGPRFADRLPKEKPVRG
jgi:RNA polymerase sigma-70 factor (ECF subfamily)